jgi:signal transduction histidine kinase
MAGVETVELRWVAVDGECDLGHAPGFSAHDLRNAVTAIMGAARLLNDRWDEIDEQRRRELVAMVLRRADEVAVMAKRL